MHRALVALACGGVAVRNRRLGVRRRGGEVRRVLVIRPDNLGDLLFATPALDRLRQAFPNAHITGAVGPWGRAMWHDEPALDEVEVVPFPGIVSRLEGGVLGPYQLLRRTAERRGREEYDLGIVLRFDHWWGAALLWAMGVPRRWGYRTPGMAEWLNRAVPYAERMHEVMQNLQLVEAAVRGTPGAQALEQLRVSRESGEPAQRPPHAVPCENVPPEWLSAPRKAAIHPGTGAANKLWTIEGWAHVADALARDGWQVALTGAPNEWVLCRAVRDTSHSKPANLAGKTANLGELTWTLGQADVVLGVDSGPLHIACALGKPTLHLYGPSDETIWGPWGDPERHRAFRAPGTHPTMRLDVLSHDLEGGPEMRAITTEMVLGEIAKLQEAARAI